MVNGFLNGFLSGKWFFMWFFKSIVTVIRLISVDFGMFAHLVQYSYDITSPQGNFTKEVQRK